MSENTDSEVGSVDIPSLEEGRNVPLRDKVSYALLTPMDAVDDLALEDSPRIRLCVSELVLFLGLCILFQSLALSFVSSPDFDDDEMGQGLTIGKRDPFLFERPNRQHTPAFFDHLDRRHKTGVFYEQERPDTHSWDDDDAEINGTGPVLFAFLPIVLHRAVLFAIDLGVLACRGGIWSYYRSSTIYTAEICRHLMRVADNLGCVLSLLMLLFFHIQPAIWDVSGSMRLTPFGIGLQVRSTTSIFSTIFFPMLMASGVQVVILTILTVLMCLGDRPFGLLELPVGYFERRRTRGRMLCCSKYFMVFGRRILTLVANTALLLLTMKADDYTSVKWGEIFFLPTLVLAAFTILWFYLGVSWTYRLLIDFQIIRGPFPPPERAAHTVTYGDASDFSASQRNPSSTQYVPPYLTLPNTDSTPREVQTPQQIEMVPMPTTATTDSILSSNAPAAVSVSVPAPAHTLSSYRPRAPIAIPLYSNPPALPLSDLDSGSTTTVVSPSERPALGPIPRAPIAARASEPSTPQNMQRNGQSTVRPEISSRDSGGGNTSPQQPTQRPQGQPRRVLPVSDGLRIDTGTQATSVENIPLDISKNKVILTTLISLGLISCSFGVTLLCKIYQVFFEADSRLMETAKEYPYIRHSMIIEAGDAKVVISLWMILTLISCLSSLYIVLSPLKTLRRTLCERTGVPSPTSVYRESVMREYRERSTAFRSRMELETLGKKGPTRDHPVCLQLSKHGTYRRVRLSACHPEFAGPLVEQGGKGTPATGASGARAAGGGREEGNSVGGENCADNALATKSCCCQSLAQSSPELFIATRDIHSCCDAPTAQVSKRNCNTVEHAYIPLQRLAVTNSNRSKNYGLPSDQQNKSPVVCSNSAGAASSLPLGGCCESAPCPLCCKECCTQCDILPQRDSVPPLATNSAPVSLFEKQSCGELHCPTVSHDPLYSTAENQSECIVCFDKAVDCVLLECGHYNLCWSCAAHVIGDEDPIKRKCPLCRAPISYIAKLDSVKIIKKPLKEWPTKSSTETFTEASRSHVRVDIHLSDTSSYEHGMAINIHDELVIPVVGSQYQSYSGLRPRDTARKEANSASRSLRKVFHRSKRSKHWETNEANEGTEGDEFLDPTKDVYRVTQYIANSPGKNKEVVQIAVPNTIVIPNVFS